MIRTAVTYPAFLILFLLLTTPGIGKTHSPDSPGVPRTASLSGYVKDAESGETLISASVLILGTGAGTTTNKSGFYSISDIQPGSYTVAFSYIGYARKEIEVRLRANESRKLNVDLEPEVFKLDEVSIERNRMDDTRQISVSRVNIPTRQISQIRIGGESDVFRSIQYLPGVLSSSQISSGLYVRGGSPDQTLVLLDGSTVYNPSHLFGFFSTFNPDAIKDVELLKGGFPAEYGGRLSAVLDLVQKDGNRNNFEGIASLGLISSKLSLQGPVGDGAWYLGGRRTYIDLLTSMIETEEDPLPDYFFYDLNGKISQDLGASDKLFLSGFTAKDDLALDSRNGFKGNIGISNYSLSTRWTHLFSDNIFSVFNLSWSRYRNGFRSDQSGFSTEIRNVIQDYSLKGNVEWFVSGDVLVKGGFEGNRYLFDYESNFTGNADSAIEEGTNEGGAVLLSVGDWVGAAFGQANYQVTDFFSLQTGLRINYYENRNLFTYDPRLAARYQWQYGITVKAAVGLYHQYFRLASLPDFSFFDTWLPTDSTVNPGQAVHYVLGIETSPVEGYDFNVDFYYKSLSHVSELNRYATLGRDVVDFFYDGFGEAYGIELFLQKKFGSFTGWAGYALGYSRSRFEEINRGEWFNPKWDRRHDLKILAQYRISDRWELGATFKFQSGQAYTGMTSRMESRIPGDNIGKSITVPAQRYGLRLPPSHQLNLSANYSSTLFGQPMRLLIDLYNVYSRRDIWFRYYDTTGDIAEVTDIRLLPIIPSVALEIKF